MVVRVGIDNGADGGIVAVGADFRVLLQEPPPFVNVGVSRKRRGTGETYEGTKRIIDEAAVVDLARRLRALGDDVFAVVEFAQVMPREGAVTSFHYGASVAAYRVALIAAGVPFEVVKPQTWQAHVLRGIEGQDTKAKSIVKAGRVLPGLDLSPKTCGDKARRGGRADAANMALYGLHLRPAPGGVPALVAPPRESRARPAPPAVTPASAPPPPPPRRPGPPVGPPPPAKAR